MRWFIILLVSLSSSLLYISILQLLLLSNKTMDKRIKHYLDIQKHKKLSLKKFNLLVQLRLYKQTIRENILTKKKNEKLKNVLNRSGIPLKPEEYILFQWILTVLGGGCMFLLFGKLFYMFVGCIFGYLLPKWWVRRQEKERIKSFNDGLQDMITTIIGSLRAGFSFSQALKTVGDESDSPIKEEIETLVRDLQYGSHMEDALYQLKDRMPSEDLDLMIQAILIQRQIGGNLATILETIVQTIRDRNKIQRQIQTLTAQGRLSGMVIGYLPIILGLLIYLIQPQYIGALFHHPAGILMMICGTVSGIFGFMLIRKITTIEV